MRPSLQPPCPLRPRPVPGTGRAAACPRSGPVEGVLGEPGGSPSERRSVPEAEEVWGNREVPPSERRSVVRCGFYPRRMAKNPSRIDLLELDIDLRLADLWRESAEISEWNIEVVAAFMRAAYGKGYCDALTEDAPGSLCHDHGYRIPGRRPAPAHEG